MKTLTLKRISLTPIATFGVLLEVTIPFTLTLERPWLNNKKGESCIPAGEYMCKRVNSPKFGNTFEVTAVPGRSHILFHKGNLADDSHGCILVGERFGMVGNAPGVLESQSGYSEFLYKLKGEDEFKLTIEEGEWKHHT